MQTTVTLGKLHGNPTPLYFARCSCGVLSVTMREHHGAAIPCRSCATSEHATPFAPSARRSSRNATLAVLALVITFLYLGLAVNGVDRADDASALAD